MTTMSVQSWKLLSLSLILFMPGLANMTWAQNPAGPDTAKTLSLDEAMAGGADVTFGELLPGSNQQLVLWWCSSGWKVSPSRPAPKQAGNAIRINAAKNEAEAAQLVVFPYREIKTFQASVTELKGPDGAAIPPEQVEVLRVRYVPVTIPSDASTVTGLWPDPLPPFKEPITLKPGENQPLWIRIKVPKESPAGLYLGDIHLEGDGMNVIVQLCVQVFDFVLPGQMTCTSAFGYSADRTFRYHGITGTEQKRSVLAKYWESLGAHHITPYNPAVLDPLDVAWPEIKDGTATNPETLKPTIDWTAWDKSMQEAFETYSFSTFQLDIPGMGGGTFHSRVEPELLGFKEDTPQYQAAFRHYCQRVQEHLREKGWLNKAFVYWFDEPEPKDYDFVMNGFRKIKEAAPDIPRMLTEEVNPALFGGPTIWCPISPEFKMEDAESRRAQGEKFWWYICTGPRAPYCTLFIDHPATELRVWLWQTWQRKIDGILIWESNYWTSNEAYPDPKAPQNPYEDPMGWTSGYSTPEGKRIPWGNGDGRFIYPPEAAANGNPAEPVLDSPVDSIRLEMLRDGIEDYEYLAILRDKIAHSTQPDSSWAPLLEVPGDITQSMTEFTKDPAPIEKRREEVARAIEQMK
jgi:hypothetical protein